jgi:succinate dehydrogenase / fumarate reductase cytochrome b subunit
MKQARRPVFLNLMRIQMPVTALLSIAHRASGLLLFLLIPVLVYLLDVSLRDPEGFARIREYGECALTAFLLAGLAWGLAHHFFAGIRFLLIDMDIGVSRDSARSSAWAVNFGAALIGVLVLVVLL